MVSKIIETILIAVLFTILTDLSSPAYTLHKVKFIYDGDTILLFTGEKVRLLGIDASEMDHKNGKHEFMALSARKYLHGLLNEMPVRLEYDKEKTDKYGRSLAYVFLESGEMVNALMVQTGLADILFFRSDLKYRDLLLECQNGAMQEKLGIWNKTISNEQN